MVAQSHGLGKVPDTRFAGDPPMTRGAIFPSAVRAMLAAAASATLLFACEGGMQAIDRRTEENLLAAADDVGGGTIRPPLRSKEFYEGDPFPADPPSMYRPPTRNPSAGELAFAARTAEEETLEASAGRIEAAGRPPAEAVPLDLGGALAFALGNAVEYLNAEENYIISALRLIIEQHRFEPRPFNITSAEFDALGQDGRFSRTLDVANDLGIAQRLPYGGEVSARLVVDLTRQIDRFGDGDTVQSADVILAAEIPFLRGAGVAAREELIQASRNLIYAARTFEEFRRDFCFSLIRAYLDLVVQQQEIANARRQVESSRQVEAREEAWVKAGRQPPFQADLAKQNTLFAIDRLAGLEERYRVAVDNFKVRIGMDPTEPLVIVPVRLELPEPETTPAQAVALAMEYRLDLQTIADEVADAKRRVDVASNQLLPDLGVSLAGVIPTNGDMRYGGLNFTPNDGAYSVAARFAAPLDRTIERSRLREAQIRFEQAVRDDRLERDRAAVEVRSALRGIDLSRFSLLLQEQNVRIALNREASIAAAPDRASARDRTEAVDQRRRAEDQRDRAAVDLQVSILAYLLATGQFRVQENGMFMPLPGMRVVEIEGTLPQDLPGAAPDLGSETPDPAMRPAADDEGVDGNFPVEEQAIPPAAATPPAI